MACMSQWQGGMIWPAPRPPTISSSTPLVILAYIKILTAAVGGYQEISASEEVFIFVTHSKQNRTNKQHQVLAYFAVNRGVMNMLQSDRFTWSMGKNTFASSPECCIRRDVYPDFSDPYQQELLFLLNLFDLRVVMVKDLIIVSLCESHECLSAAQRLFEWTE